MNIDAKVEEKITALAHIFYNISEDPIIREILIDVFADSNKYVEEILAQKGKEKLTLYCIEQKLSIPPEIAGRLARKYDDIIRMIFIEIISNKKVDECYKDMLHKSELKQLLIRYIIEEFPHLIHGSSKNEDGWNALHHSCHRGFFDSVEVLLKHTTDLINTIDVFHYTPLHLTVLGLIENCCKGTGVVEDEELDRYRKIIDILIQNNAIICNDEKGSSVIDYIKLQHDFPADIRDKLNAYYNYQENKCSYCGITQEHKHQTNPSDDLKFCSRCRLVKYCGPICQKAHYNKHKVTCKKVEIIHSIPFSCDLFTGKERKY